MKTVYEIRQKTAELEAELESLESAQSKSLMFVDETEREKLHQEDLQRIRGFRLKMMIS